MSPAGQARAQAHLATTQALVRRQANVIQRAWRGLDAGGLRASYLARVAPVFVAAIGEGQTEAASLAEPYVNAELAPVGAPPSPPPSVMPSAFAGFTTTGLALPELADVVVVRLLADIGGGRSTTDAMTAGLRRALTYASTEITDAGRSATQVQLIADDRAAGHERVVKLPACDRCVILTGRLYRYSQGFARHPRCDCAMKPVTYEQWASDDLDNTPAGLFGQMSAEEQNARFGVRNAEAIRSGADMSQVVNARRGAMSAAGRWTTTQGATSRGLAGKRMGELAKQPDRRYRRARLERPTAGQLIAEHASSSREELTAALHRYGYVL